MVSRRASRHITAGGVGVSGHSLSIGLVFLAGALSFCSPCVLAVIPAYLSLVSGLSFAEMQAGQLPAVNRWRLLTGALAFILGFGVVTVLGFGTVARLVGELGGTWQTIIRWVGFAVIVLFALHIMGVLRITALYTERRFHLTTNRWGLPGAALVGAAFGFGWMPCIGPTLGSVFTLVAGGDSPALAWWYFTAYVAGLAVPFLLAALCMHVFLGSVQQLTRHLRVIEVSTGILLLLMGIMLVTNNLTLISAKLMFLRALTDRLEGLLP